MDADTILGELERAGHGAHAAAVRSLIQPAIRVRARALAPSPYGDDGEAAAFDAALAALPIGASRFGGVPDLPAGVAWPERDGVPMEFVAQLRLDECAGLDPQGRLPATGSLWFFYNSQWTTYDQDQDHGSCAVIYDDGAPEALVRAQPPQVPFQSEFADEPTMAPRIHGLAALRFDAWLTVPGGVSPFITGPLKEFWQDFMCDVLPAFQGRAAPAQAADDEFEHEEDAEYADDDGASATSDDDAEFNQLLGHVDAQDYVDAHEHGTGDQLLLMVASDDAADFQWGDCDNLYFLLHRDELARRDFSKVRVYSQMG